MLFNKIKLTFACILLGISTNLYAQSSTFRIIQTENTPGAPSVAQSVTAGNCTIGQHNFSVSYVTAGGETDASNPSAQVSCSGTVGRITVTIPVGGKFVTGRNIYASKIGDANVRYLVAASPVVSNNTATSYTFNTSDATLLSTIAPTSNNATNTQWTFLNNGDLAPALTTQTTFSGDKAPLNSPIGWCSTDVVTGCTLDTAFWSSGASVVSLGNGTLNDSSGSLALATVFVLNQFKVGNQTTINATAPTVTSAGTSPTVPNAAGTLSFRINVGTGGSATTIVLAMPASTANGWNCSAENITGNAANRADARMAFQSSTATAVTMQYQTVSTGTAKAFTASDIVSFLCSAF